MRLFLILVTLVVLAPGLATVKDMGHCDDVGSVSCPVRDYWPQNAGNPTGVAAYWLLSDNTEVCFVTQRQYEDAHIGQTFDCLWRRPATIRSRNGSIPVQEQLRRETSNKRHGYIPG